MKAAVAMALIVGMTGLGQAQGAPGLPADHPDAVRAQAAEAERRAEDAVQKDLRSIVPLNVHVVVSKYQGDRRISSMPYTVTLANDNVRVGVRMGTKIPVQTLTAPGAGAMFNYQDVGTNIDALARSLDSGRFSVTLIIEDNSVTQPESRDGNATAPQIPPVIRNYRSTSTLILRDGQTTQFTAASDKVTGEVIKADVTLTVVK